MARNRVIYQSEALYVSDDATSLSATNHLQLERVQSANYSFSIGRQDINQYGQLSRIDTMILESPTVNMDISYYLTDGYNENALGFSLTDAKGFLSGHMLASAGKNLYIATSKEGFDANGMDVLGDQFPCIALGNAYLTNYGVELAIGAVPTVSVSFEASNICSTSTSATSVVRTITGITHPAIKQEDGTVYTTSNATLPSPIIGQDLSPSALRPGDITLSFGEFTIAGTGKASPINQFNGGTGMHIQSASLSIPLNRSSLQRVGSKFAYARSVDFPIKATLSIKAIVNEITARNLAGMISDSVEKNIILTLNDEIGLPKSTYTLKGCTLDSESISSSIGSNKSVDLTFSTQVGGIDDSTRGVFYKGTSTRAIENNLSKSYPSAVLFTTYDATAASRNLTVSSDSAKWRMIYENGSLGAAQNSAATQTSAIPNGSGYRVFGILPCDSLGNPAAGAKLQNLSTLSSCNIVDCFNFSQNVAGTLQLVSNKLKSFSLENNSNSVTSLNVSTNLLESIELNNSRISEIILSNNLIVNYTGEGWSHLDASVPKLFMTNNKLSLSSVNSIISSAISGGRSNGYLYLDGGTNAKPTVDYSLLTDRTWTTAFNP